MASTSRTKRAGSAGAGGAWGVALAVLGGVAGLACGCGGDAPGADAEDAAEDSGVAIAPEEAKAAEVLAYDAELAALVTVREVTRLQAQLSTAAKLISALDTIAGVHDLVNEADAHTRGGSTTKGIVLGLRRSGEEVGWEEGSTDVRYLGVRLRIHGDPDPEDEGRDGDGWRCYGWPDEGSQVGLCFVVGRDAAVYGTSDATYLGARGPDPGAADGDGDALAPAKNAPWRGRDGLTWRPASEVLDAVQARLRLVRDEGLPEDELRALVREALRSSGSGD